MSAGYTNNNLSLASSTYLQQHKDSPVAWQEWSPATLAYAREQGRPILLSIGYAVCHWCQIMAEESFADPDTAQLMNELFINIKVDREERPDLDKVYQSAHQFLTGRPGGWPLTVFLCPRSHLPFLVGTYFPRQPAQGQLAFKDLLQGVADCFRAQDRDFFATLERVEASYQTLREAQLTPESEATLSAIPIERAGKELLKQADTVHGGFGSAPKFPMPPKLERLCELAEQAQWRVPAREHLARTLRAMAGGGLRDQAGGFFRYAMDAGWREPHPEKMLYDNGQLLAVYAQGWRLLRDPELKAGARHIATWALTQMRRADGAFCASSGPRGRDDKVLTAWNAQMIRGLTQAARLLGERDYLLAAQRALDFLRQELWLNQRLHATWQGGRATIPGYLDDYAFLLDALLEMLRTQWRDCDYRFATLLAEALIEKFEDKEEGGFYFTAQGSEELLLRPKPFTDGVMPAGNGVAAKALGRLGQLCGEPRYRDCARRCLLNGWGSMLRQPAEHHNALLALAEHLEPPLLVLMKGAGPVAQWQESLQEQFGDRIFCYRVPADSKQHPPEFLVLEENQALVCTEEGGLEPQEQLDGLLGQVEDCLRQRQAVG